MKMFKLRLYLPLLFIWACTDRTEKSKPQQTIPVHWQYLTLELNDTVIQVAKSIDTLEVTTFKEGVQRFPISHPEMDSLFSWSNELIDFHGQPKQFCTDYVGKLKVRIRYNSQLLKEVSFSSICDWKEISAKTSQLDQLLRKVMGPNIMRTTLDF
jgi:hypothetical protein